MREIDDRYPEYARPYAPLGKRRRYGKLTGNEATLFMRRARIRERLRRYYAVGASVLIMMAILLPRFFGLDGVLYSFPTADVLTFILTVVVILQVYRELSAENRIINMKTEARALSAP